MNIEKIAARVASRRVAAVPELERIVSGNEGLAPVLEDFMIAVRQSFAVAEREGVSPESVALMDEEATLLELTLESVLPKIKELDEKILAAL